MLFNNSYKLYDIVEMVHMQAYNFNFRKTFQESSVILNWYLHMSSVKRFSIILCYCFSILCQLLLGYLYAQHACISFLRNS